LSLPFGRDTFWAIITSPVYGNRMSDKYMGDGTYRATYPIYLGRPVSETSSAQLQWSQAYRNFHMAAWKEAQRVLKPGGLFILNVKDHIRKGERQLVSEWHKNVIVDSGFTLLENYEMPVQGMRAGANNKLRIEYEDIWAFRAPTEKFEELAVIDV